MSPNAEMVKLFYDLWDDMGGGQEYLVSHEAPDAAEKLPRAHLRDVQLVMHGLNRIGHLVASGALDADFVTTLVGKDIIRVVERLRPFLEDERKKRSDPQFDDFVDRLYEAARQAYPDYQPWYAPAEERRGIGLRV